MKQLVLRAGNPQIVEVPAPGAEPGRVLVANAASVISTGTERAALEYGGGGLASRALRNPELIKAGLQHLRQRGLRETVDVARGVTSPDSPLGYSCAGFVLDTGGIADFRAGQLVACAGAGLATHAEIVSVPGNLVAGAPDGLDPSAAAFATIGSIALQGVRRAQPALGERVVVIGLGLIGLLTVQLLAVAGCRVFGVEPDERRRELGLKLGAEAVAEPGDAPAAVGSWSDGVGADAVVVCAAGGQGIANGGVVLLRAKGRLVVVGDVPLSFERGPLYVREADVLISTSYGPGRYDATYEESGVDYPVGYVRWTENRNMGEVLRLLASGKLDVESLVELEVPIDRAVEAYEKLGGASPPLTAVLTYDQEAGCAGARTVRTSGPVPAAQRDGSVRIAIVGAGGFVRSMHLPNLKTDPRARVVVVAARGGGSASDAARLAGGADATTDWRTVIERDDVDLVLIATRHDSHAEIAAAALGAGKAVFVEKPLGLSRDEIDLVRDAARSNDRLAIGFNRPFAPLARVLEGELRQLPEAPVQLVYRVSAPLDPAHWLNDPAIGGGRILGEACHMFDFASWLCGSPERVLAAALPSTGGVHTVESVSVTIQYGSGSVATVHYSAIGAKTMPKERIEVMSGGRSWVLDDFLTLTSYGKAGPETQTSRIVDKGHAELVRRVLGACRGEAPFEPGIGPAYVAQLVALAAVEAVASGQPQLIAVR